MLKLRRTRRLVTVLLSFGAVTLGSVGASGLASANDVPGRWYQIEVILFTHENSADDETARNDVVLTYPANWVELKNPEAVAAVATGEPAPTEAPASPDLARDPFYTLPANLRELNRQADALKRSSAHRLLFHEAWRQPVGGSATTPAIVVSAGKPYDDHRELEGSFAVSLSRYLHLNTNLWLTEFVRADAGADDRDYWPELPQRPSQKQVQLNASLLQPESDAADYGWDSDTTAWERALQLDDAYDFSTTPVSKDYVPEQISVLRQQRRMRSGEVHYLDHPHMGMVVLITPYDVPAKAAIEAPGAGAIAE